MAEGGNVIDNVLGNIQQVGSEAMQAHGLLNNFVSGLMEGEVTAGRRKYGQ